MESSSLMMHYRQQEDENKPSSNCKVSTTNLPASDDQTSILKEDGKSSNEEKAFLRRLDWILITYVWTSYCIKQIDASNYKTAYVSGMKEDLNLHGNELNYFDAVFRIGYAISIIPSSLLLSTYRPSVLLPSLELVWGFMTGLMAFASSPTLIYIARFIIGICEASSYPGTITILMNWYTPAELSTRVSLFSTSYPAASIFVGSLQAALWGGLNGTSGMAGWRWLFLLNGIMTIFVAVAGYAIIPDSPNDSRAWWLSARGREISQRRMQRAGKSVGSSGEVQSLGDWLRLTVRLACGWKLWAFGAVYALWSFSQNANAWFPLYLKSLTLPDGSRRFSVEQVNLVPIPAYLLSGTAMVLFSALSDRKQHRARYITVQLVVHMGACIALARWPETFVRQMVAMHLLFVSSAAGPVVLAWLAEEVKEVPEERTVMVAAMVTVVYAVDCWANLFLWPAKEAPRYRYGYAFAAVFAAGSIGVAGWIKWRLGGWRGRAMGWGRIARGVRRGLARRRVS